MPHSRFKPRFYVHVLYRVFPWFILTLLLISEANILFINPSHLFASVTAYFVLLGYITFIVCSFLKLLKVEVIGC